MTGVGARLGEWVVRYRWWIIAVTMLWVVAAGLGLRLLSFNNDSRAFFSPENPQLKALEALENTYSKEDNLLFVVAPGSGDVFGRRTLSLVHELTGAAWKIPYSSRVDSITNFQHTWAAGDELMVEDLVRDPAALSDRDRARIRKIALAEPLLVNRLVSPDGRVTGVSVTIVKPGKSRTEVPEIVAAARKMVAGLARKYPDIKVRLTSGIMIDSAFGVAGEQDLKTLVPAMYAVLLVILGLSLRSVLVTLATLVVIAISMVTGMGLAGWFHIALTPASANAPTIILTLAVADSVHLLVTMLQQMRHGKERHRAVIESMRINLQPVFVTSFTTAIGFLTMNFSDAPPFHDLGNIVTMGVVAAFVYSVLFLPALVSVLPVRAGSSRDIGCAWCDRVAELVVHHRKGIFLGLLAATILLSGGMLRIDLDDNFIKYFDHRYAFRRDADFCEQNLTGLDLIEYSLDSGEPGGINDPAYLATVAAFADWYRAQPKVTHVHGITGIMKRLNQNMHNDDPAWYRIPGRRDLAAQYLLLYEMSLPFGLDLNNRINLDKSATRLTVILKDMTAKELRQMDERARDWLRKNAPPAMFTYGTGLSIMFAHISERNIRSMLGGSFVALLLISATLVVLLRSVKLGLISLVPNLTPALMAFGIWGLTVGRVGLAVSVLVSMTLGIVVDDTVHFISKYLRARREHGMCPADSVRYAFHTVGTALWVTSAALVAGFLVLALSGFTINHDMGLMSAITITLALGMDFLFLPTLLLLVEGDK